MINFKVKSPVVMALIALAAIVFILISPFFVLWSLNILFPALAIPYTFETWCATILIGVFLRGEGIKFNKND
jgi:hypothetical protein